MLLFCVFAAALVKCFTIDLALLFRPCVSQINHSEGKEQVSIHDLDLLRYTVVNKVLKTCSLTVNSCAN